MYNLPETQKDRQYDLEFAFCYTSKIENLDLHNYDQEENLTQQPNHRIRIIQLIY